MKSLDWREKTRQARLRVYELAKARWATEAKTIDHQPTTILGGDHGGEALPPGDPAA